MSKRKLRIILGLAILGLACVLLAWGFWPLLQESRILLVSPENLRLPVP